jgi:hypothetical protein
MTSAAKTSPVIETGTLVPGLAGAYIILGGASGDPDSVAFAASPIEWVLGVSSATLPEPLLSERALIHAL